MDVTDYEHRRRRSSRSTWIRPDLAQRADQCRSDSEIPAEALATQALRALAEVWRRAAEGERQAPPSRETFHPTDALEAVGRMTVLDRVPHPAGPNQAGPNQAGTNQAGLGHTGANQTGSGHTWKYRLVGTEIVLILQADVTGQTIELYHPPLAAMLRRQFDRACELGWPVASAIRTVVDDRPYAYEQIVLPTRRRRDGPVDQVVVASHPVTAADPA